MFEKVREHMEERNKKLDYACLYDKPGMIREHQWNHQEDYLILHNVTTRQRICFAGWKYENYKKWVG